MKKLIIFTAILAAMIGLTTAATPVQDGGLFGDRQLESLYLVDDQDNYFGVLFEEEQGQLYGNVESINELNSDSTEVCKHYIKPGGLLRGERTSQIECVPLNTQQNTTPQTPPNTTNTTENTSLNTQTGKQVTDIQYKGNGTISPPEKIPDYFRATDNEGNVIQVIVNDRGEPTAVFGSTNSLEDFNKETTQACEYYIQLNPFGDYSSQINCYDYQGLEQRIMNGSIPYLSLTGQVDSQAEDNQTGNMTMNQTNQSLGNQTNQSPSNETEENDTIQNTPEIENPGLPV